MILHTPTLFWVMIAICGVLAVCISFIAYRRHHDLLLWSLALALQGGAIALIGQRGQISNTLSIVVGNTLLYAMFAMYGEAVYRFNGRSPPRWLMWSPVFIIAVSFALLVDNLQVRLVLGSTLMGLQCCVVLFSLLQIERESPSRGLRVLLAGGVLVGGMLAIRVMAFLFLGVQMESFLVSTATQSYSFLAGIVATLVFALGFLTMNQERAEAAATRAAFERERSEARYRLLIESAEEGIFVAQNGIVTFANPKMLELMGYSQGELLGHNLEEFVRADDRQTALREYKSLLLGQSSRRLQVRVVTGQQAIRWFEISGAPFEWEGHAATLNFCIDISDRKQMEEDIRQLAFHDPLTDLPNRRLFLDRLTQAMVASKRSLRYCAVLFLDLDKFKYLNDAHGHACGDQLLIEVAARLNQCVREVDTVARFGGDEFVVLLRELSDDREASFTQTRVIAEKIRIALSAAYELTEKHVESDDILIRHQCSASIGVTLFSNHPASAEDILQCADEAMYCAKEAGRNTVRFAELQGVNTNDLPG